MAVSKAKYEKIQREQRIISFNMAKYLIDKLKDIDPTTLLDNDDFIFDFIFDFFVHFELTGYSKAEAFFNFHNILYLYNVPLTYKAIKEQKKLSNRILIHKKKESIITRIQNDELNTTQLEELNQQLSNIRQLENQIHEIDTAELDIFYIFQKYWNI